MGDRALTLLLSFGESIASSQKSPEKLFVLLDMYEAIRDIMPVVSGWERGLCWEYCGANED